MTDRPDRVAARVLAGVAVLSGAMLAFEIALTRLFAVAQFHHFAFMAISLALLGGGAAGSLLAVWPGLARRPERWAAGFGLAALASFAILQLAGFDSYAIAWDRRQIANLAATFGAASLPFVCSGLVVGGQMARRPTDLHRVYGANLAGSALGSLLVLPLLAVLGAEGALVASASLGLGAAALLAPSSRGERRRMWPALALAAAAGLVAVAASGPAWLELRLSPYKGLSQALLAPGARHTVSAWSTVARVDVVESRALHVLPGLSQNLPLERPPRQAGLTLDGDNLQPLTDLDPAEPLAVEIAAHVPEAVAGALRPSAERLVLYPGAGWPVLTALAGGAPRVTVVERSALVAATVRDTYADFTHHLYTNARVELIEAPPRSFLRATDRHFPVLVIGLADGFRPVTSGAYGLGEDYRYTVEAFGDALDRLEPGGLLVVTRWLQTPPTESLRTLAALEGALRASGRTRPADHLAAFRSMRTVTILAADRPLSSVERDAVRAFADTRGYDLVWLPDLRADETNWHLRLPTPAYADGFAALLADPAGFVADHAYDIRPATDVRPFSNHYFRWRQTPTVLAGLGRTWQPFGGSGYLVLVALAVLVTLLAAALICGPLVAGRVPVTAPPAPGAPGALRGPRRVRARSLVYFAMLGLGFLFVELPLAQQLVLFIGEPVTALAIVLFAVLLFSGLGSLTAPRWRLQPALALLVVAALSTPLVARGLLGAALGWPAPARAVVAVVALAPLGVLMGVPFARGLAVVEARAPGLIPWAWAVNGSTSVLSAVLAVMAALSWGFPTVLLLGAAAYAVALVAIAPLCGAPAGPDGGHPGGANGGRKSA